MTTTVLARALTRVTLNPHYAVPLDHGDLCITRFPGGHWAAKIRPRGSQWIGFITPRLTTTADPILIAVGDDRQAVQSVMLRWTEQAVTLACRINAVVYAGTGNATHERLNTDDLDGQWAVLDTQERR